MKIIQYSTGLWLLCSASLALADNRQVIDETRSVSANERVTIEVQRGKVTIRGSQQNQFKVSGKLDEQAEGFTLDSNAGFTQFVMKMPRQLNSYGNTQGADLVIEVPQGTNLEFKGVNSSVAVDNIRGGSLINTVNGDITGLNLSNAVELSTVNGAIDSKGLQGQLRLKTINGKIEDEGARGRLQVESINGEIDLKSQPDELFLTVVNGEVELELTGTAQMEISTVNGSVEVTLKQQNTPRIKGSSVSGKFELKLAAELDATVSMKTSAGGSIKNSLTTDQPSRAKYGPASSLQFSSGSGTGAIDISTVSGKLELSKN